MGFYLIFVGYGIYGIGAKPTTLFASICVKVMIEVANDLCWFLLQLSEIVSQGKLVSDEIIIGLLSKRLEAGEANGESGFILDGFPRTIKQAVRCWCFELFVLIKSTSNIAFWYSIQLNYYV